MVFKQEKTCRLNKNVNTGGIWSMGGSGNKELCEASKEKKNLGGFDVKQIFHCGGLASPVGATRWWEAQEKDAICWGAA